MSQTETVHHAARRQVIAGFAKVYGREPVLCEAQVVQGVGWLETRYGTAWKPPPVPAKIWPPKNMGAIQCCQPVKGACPDDTFLYVDTHPMPDGSSKAYSVCFKAYLTEEAGFYDLARTVMLIHNRDRVMKAAWKGSVWDCSAQLHDTGYYEGFGKNREERIGNHTKALGSAIARQAQALDEPIMEPFSIDEYAEEQMLLGRVRFLAALGLEYRHGDIAEMARKALLEEAERDAFGKP